MSTSELGERRQILWRLSAVIQVLDEILQLQMILRIELLPQILRHEAIKIGPHHFPADVHATALVTHNITQWDRFLHDVFPIIKAGVWTRPEDAGDAFLMAQHGMTGRHHIVGDMDFGISELFLEHLFDQIAILFAATACTVIMDELNVVVW